jgi:hypothetical protein
VFGLVIVQAGGPQPLPLLPTTSPNFNAPRLPSKGLEDTRYDLLSLWLVSNCWYITLSSPPVFFADHIRPDGLISNILPHTNSRHTGLRISCMCSPIAYLSVNPTDFTPSHRHRSATPPPLSPIYDLTFYACRPTFTSSPYTTAKTLAPPWPRSLCAICAC